MNMSIQNNIIAINAERMVSITSGKKSKSTEKLSSGYRVNRAADDAAGLAISEKMRRQIKGLTQAERNCQDGISMVQIADGALNEIHDMIHRGSELSVQAANGTLTQDDRRYIQQELDQLIQEIDKISERTTFNEIQVLKGKSVDTAEETEVEIRGQLPAFVSSAALGAGYMNETYTANGKDYISGMVDFSQVNAGNIEQLADTGFNMTCATCDKHYSIRFTTGESSVSRSGNNYIYDVSLSGISNGNDLVDRIIETADHGQPNSHYTALTKSGEGKLVAYDVRSDLATTGQSRRNATMTSGVAYSTAEESENGSILIQAGAESGQYIYIDLPNISSEMLGLDEIDVTATMENRGFDGAGMAIAAFKRANEYVSEERSRMGAYQNRLEHTVNNLNNVVENTTAAESQIRDTDISEEMVRYSNLGILEQAGMSVLSQANQQKQGILNLLQ